MGGGDIEYESRLQMKKCRLVAAVCAVGFFVSLALGATQQRGSASTPGASASAKPVQTPQADKADPDTPEADDALNMTDDQRARIKAIRDDAQEQIKAMQKDKTLSDEQRQKKAKQIKMDTRKQVWSVLTPEQRKIWADEARERREAKSHPNPQ